MTLLHEYKVGDKVSCADDSAASGLTWPVQKYCDAPKSRIVCIAAARQKLTMQFAGKVADQPADILVDSGAGNSFISEAFASGIRIEHIPGTQVTLPDSEASSVVGKCQVRVRIQSYQCLITCYATPLADHFDMILDESWLLHRRAYLDYGDLCCVLRKGRKRITLSCPRPASKLHAKPVAASFFLSALQAKRAVSRGAQVRYVQVTEVKGADSPSITVLGMDSTPESLQTSPDNSLMSQGQL